MVLTWVVVCHRAGARILEHKGQTLRLLHEVVHASGRLKDRQLVSDRPGRGHDRKGPGGHAFGSEQSPHDHDAESFAREIAGQLETGRLAKRFERVVLVAEPRFLGLLRGSLDHVTSTKVAATLSKDLAHIPSAELHTHLNSVLLV
jgi:protein required for attachment to host cells